MEIKIGNYKHSKSGKEYKVIGIAKHSETLEEMVVYQPQYESDAKFWVRPAGMREGDVEVNSVKKRRFEKVEDKQDMVLQVGVKALIRNRVGKYLLLRRSLVKYPEIKGRWDIVGGRINTDSGLLENLKREISEETGLAINDKIKLVAAQDIRRVTGKYVVRLTYLAQTKGNEEVKLDESENDKFEWLSMAELKKKKDVDIF